MANVPSSVPDPLDKNFKSMDIFGLAAYEEILMKRPKSARAISPPKIAIKGSNMMESTLAQLDRLIEKESRKNSLKAVHKEGKLSGIYGDLISLKEQAGDDPHKISRELGIIKAKIKARQDRKSVKLAKYHEEEKKTQEVRRQGRDKKQIFTDFSFGDAKVAARELSPQLKARVSHFRSINRFRRAPVVLRPEDTEEYWRVREKEEESGYTFDTPDTIEEFKAMLRPDKKVRSHRKVVTPAGKVARIYTKEERKEFRNSQNLRRKEKQQKKRFQQIEEEKQQRLRYQQIDDEKKGIDFFQINAEAGFLDSFHEKGMKAVLSLGLDIFDFFWLIHTITSDIDNRIKSQVLTFWLKSYIGNINSHILGISVVSLIELAPRIKWKNEPTDKPEFPRDVMQINQQALSDELDKIGDVLEYVFSSAFSDAIQTLLVYGAFAHIFPKEVAQSIYTWCGAPPKGVPMLAICEKAIKAAARIIRTVENVYGGMGWQEAMFMKDPAVENRLIAAQLLLQKDYLYTGIPKEGMYNRTVWLKQCRSCIQYFEQRLKLTSSMRAEYAELARLHSALTGAFSAVAGSTSNGYRMTPFGIILGELPGIGKSNLMRLICANLMKCEGLKFYDEMVFHVDTNSDYMEGLINQPIYHYSELGTEKEKIAETKGCPSAMALTSVIDSQAKLAPMAFELKGKIWMEPHAVIGDTNNMGLNFDLFCINPAAFERRFFYVMVTVKHEFLKTVNGKYSCEIDGAKVWAAVDAKTIPSPFHVYKFTCYIKVAVNRKDSLKQFICERVEVDEFLRILRERYIAHLAAQERMKATVEKGFDILNDFGEDLVDINADALAQVKEKTHGEVFVEQIGNFAKKSVDKVAEVVDFAKNRYNIAGLKSFLDTKCQNKGWDPVNVHTGIDKPSGYFNGGVDAFFNERLYKDGPTYSYVETPDTEMSNMEEKFDNNGVSIVNYTETVLDGRRFLSSTGAPKLFDELTEGKIDVAAGVKANDAMVVEVETIDAEAFVDRTIQDFNAKGGELHIPANFVTNCAKQPWAEHYSQEELDQAFEYLTHNLQYGQTQRGRAYYFPFWASGLHAICNCMLAELDPTSWIVFNPDEFLHQVGEDGEKRMQVRPVVMTGVPFKDFEPYHEVRVVLRRVYEWVNKLITMLCIWISHYKWFKSWGPWWVRNRGKILGAGVVCGILLAVIAAFKAKRRAMKVQAQAHHMEKYGEMVDAGPGFTRIKTKSTPDSWNEVSSPVPMTPMTDKPEVAYKPIMRNARYAHVYQESGGRLTGYLYGLKGDLCMMCDHYFPIKTGPWKVEACAVGGGELSKQSHELIIRETDLVRAGNDVVFFRHRSLQFKDMTGMFNSSASHSVDGLAYFKNQACRYSWLEDCVVENVGKACSTFIRSPIQTEYDSEEGDCGLPVVGAGKNSSYIMGIHVGGKTVGGSKFGYATTVTRDMIFDAEEKLHRGFCVAPEALSVSEEETFSALVDIKRADLIEPHPKTPFHFEQFDKIEILGALKAPLVVNQKSALRKSIFCESNVKESEFLAAFYNAFGELPKTRYGKPMMAPGIVDGEYVSLYNIGLRKMGKPIPPPLDPNVCDFIVQKLASRIITSLRGKGYVKLQPFNINVALNGGVMDEFFGGIKLRTASGFGFPGDKTKYVVEDERKQRSLTPEADEALRRAFDKLIAGERPNFVFSASPKDEPRSLEKCRAGKTRLFYQSNFTALVLSRMFLAPLFELMVSENDIFCTSVGINMHREAEAFYERMRKFSKNYMCGDFSGFDVSMHPEISRMVSRVVYEVFRSLGYSETALRIVAGLLYEHEHVNICILNVILRAIGCQPSGRYGTVNDNVLRNLLIQMYAFYIQPELRNKDFFEEVLLALFGDDNVGAIKDAVAEFFNNIKLAEVAKKLGMEYTTSDKGEVTERFQTAEEMSYLKRRFRKHPATGRIVGQLEIDSIFKMLEWTEPSTVATPSDQMKSTIDSCLRESFFHLPRTSYDQWRQYLAKVYANKFGLDKSVEAKYFHSYDKLIGEYNGAEDTHIDFHIQCEARLQPLCTSRGERSLDIEGETGLSLIEGKQQCSSESQIQQLYAELKEAETDLEGFGNPCPGVHPSHFHLLPDMASNSTFREIMAKYTELKSRVESIKATIAILESRRSLTTIYARQQSGEMPGMADKGVPDANAEIQHENYVEVGGDETKTYSAGKSVNPTSSSELGLGEFLARPVDIGTQIFALGTNSIVTFTPYQTLLSDPSIMAKLRNFGYLRANLKVRIAVSGSFQHYGRLFATYVPFPALNDFANFYVNTASTSVYLTQKLTYFTQMTGCEVIDVSDNTPVEMEIPYISMIPLLRLYNNSTSAITSFSDVALGTLVVGTLAPPQVVNNSTGTGISVNVIAWLEDVSLHHTTGTVITITTESKELKSGPVEKFASSAIAVTSAMTRVPIIGPYAKASEMIARGLKEVAALFGWSVPNMTPTNFPPSLIRPDAFQGEVNTVGYCLGKKMTFDPLCEVTVDPSLAGVTEDEMAIMSIARRWSYLDSFTWASTATPMATNLWHTVVHPLALQVGPIAASKMAVQPTALAFAAQPFASWHGDIEYKIDIVCSKLHRGKIAILFEPNVAHLALVEANYKLHKQNLIVLDIQQTNSLTFCVKWAQAKYWHQCNTFQGSYLRMVGSSYQAPTTYTWFNVANGAVTIFPFTELTSSDASSVVVNMYVRAGKEFAVNQLVTENLPTIRTNTQSHELGTDELKCFEMNENVLDCTKRSIIHYGEEPKSFRPYMRRYVTISNTYLAGTAGAYVYTGVLLPNISNYFGSAGGGVMDIASYIRPAFLGLRGSIRKRFRITGHAFTVGDQIRVTAKGPTATAPAASLTLAGSYPVVSSSSGTAVFVPLTNGGYEVEFPYYSNMLWWPAGIGLTSSLVSLSNTQWDPYQTYTYSVSFETSQATSQNVNVIEETAYGDDFTLLRYVAAPLYTTTNY